MAKVSEQCSAALYQTVACKEDLFGFLNKAFDLLPVMTVALALAYVIHHLWQHYRNGFGIDFVVFANAAFATTFVLAITDYVSDHKYDHPSFTAFAFAFAAEVLIRFFHHPVVVRLASNARDGALAGVNAVAGAAGAGVNAVAGAAGAGVNAVAGAAGSAKDGAIAGVNALAGAAGAGVNAVAGAVQANLPTRQAVVASFATTILVSSFSFYLWTEGALVATISHFVSFVPDKYWTRFMAFPSLALWAYEHDTKGCVVAGTPLVQLGETLMLLQVYRLSAAYAATLFRYITGHTLPWFNVGGQNPDQGALLHDLVIIWGDLAWKCYVLGFLPDTKKDNEVIHHSVVKVHNLYVIVAGLMTLNSAFNNHPLNHHAHPVYHAVNNAVDGIFGAFEQIAHAVYQFCADVFHRLQDIARRAVRGGGGDAPANPNI